MDSTQFSDTSHKIHQEEESKGEQPIQ